MCRQERTDAGRILQAFQDVSLEGERQVGASQRFEFSLNRDIAIVINEITEGESDER